MGIFLIGFPLSWIIRALLLGFYGLCYIAHTTYDKPVLTWLFNEHGLVFTCMVLFTLLMFLPKGGGKKEVHK